MTDSINQCSESFNDGGVCRTAPATPGLVITQAHSKTKNFTKRKLVKPLLMQAKLSCFHFATIYYAHFLTLYLPFTSIYPQK